MLTELRLNHIGDWNHLQSSLENCICMLQTLDVLVGVSQIDDYCEFVKFFPRSPATSIARSPVLLTSWRILYSFERIPFAESISDANCLSKSISCLLNTDDCLHGIPEQWKSDFRHCIFIKVILYIQLQ